MTATSALPSSGRHRRGSSTAFLLLGTLCAVLLGGLTALALSGSGGSAKTTIEIPLILAGGSLAALLAVHRFDIFVCVLVAVRTGLDAARAGALPATVVVAGVFVLFSVAWLLVQRASGTVVKLGLLSRAAICFVVAALLSVVTSDQPSVSLQEWTRLLSAMMMLIVLERLFATTPAALPRMLFAAYLSFLPPVLLGTYQRITHRGLNYSDGLDRVRGTFAHPNSFAMYLAFMIVMGVALLWYTRGWYRWSLVAILFMAVGMLYFTQTRGSWIGAVVGVLVVVGLRSRRMLAAVLVVVAVFAALPPVWGRFHDLSQETRASGAPGNSLVWRVDHWEQSLQLAKEKPVTGIGLRMIEVEAAGGKLAHNDYVRSYVEGGVPGLVTYLGLLAALATTGVRAVRRARDRLGRSVAVGFMGCVAALLLISASDNLITQSVVLWYVALFAAAASAVSKAARSVPRVAEKVST